MLMTQFLSAWSKAWEKSKGELSSLFGLAVGCEHAMMYSLPIGKGPIVLSDFIYANLR